MGRANPRRADSNEIEMDCLTLNQYIAVLPQGSASALDYSPTVTPVLKNICS